MAIPDADIARVREAADLVAIVSEHVQLRQVGRRFIGQCPFRYPETLTRDEINQRRARSNGRVRPPPPKQPNP